MSELNERELKIMRAIAGFGSGASIDAIASKLGYRPARSGRLAVVSSLNSMLRRHGGVTHGPYGTDGKYIGRLPPRDQWDHSRWFLTDAGMKIVATPDLLGRDA